MALDVVAELLAQTRLAQAELRRRIAMRALLLRRLLLQPAPHPPQRVLAQLQTEALVDGAHHAQRISVKAAVIDVVNPVRMTRPRRFAAVDGAAPLACFQRADASGLHVRSLVDA